VGSDLFVTSDVPVLHWITKTFESMIDKLYRLNVLWNNRWPRPPAANDWAAGSEAARWIGPYDCLRRLDDVIRTRIVCKYLDGPAFLTPMIKDLAEGNGIGCEVHPRELDAGYYSHHVYFDVEAETIGPRFESVRTKSRVELQITTQLQDVLMSLTHRFYEKDRLQSSRREKPWRWDYKTARFKGAYLGHTLHLLEAIVIEVRDQSGETNG
jgi:ppGpp synthetase/RelA/SpoT-type nucleotidyltranferase